MDLREVMPILKKYKTTINPDYASMFSKVKIQAKDPDGVCHKIIQTLIGNVMDHPLSQAITNKQQVMSDESLVDCLEIIKKIRIRKIIKYDEEKL